MTTKLTVTCGHRSSIPGARWCQPAGWSPRNTIKGADWDDSCGCWTDEDGDAAGVIVFTPDAAEGDQIEVATDDLRVASCGDCRVIGPVEIDFA